MMTATSVSPARWHGPQRLVLVPSRQSKTTNTCFVVVFVAATSLNLTKVDDPSTVAIFVAALVVGRRLGIEGDDCPARKHAALILTKI